jgi:hypothetical protein
VTLFRIVLCLLVFGPGSGKQKPVTPPASFKFIQLKLAGVDLLHASEETIEKRFGRGERLHVESGILCRYRDPQANTTLQFIFDEESGSVKSASVLKTAPSPIPSVSSMIHLLQALTEGGVALNQSASGLERILGKPTKIERGKEAREDYLYRAPMRPDGSLPAYRARYNFQNGRLVGLTIALGE